MLAVNGVNLKQNMRSVAFKAAVPPSSNAEVSRLTEKYLNKYPAFFGESFKEILTQWGEFLGAKGMKIRVSTSDNKPVAALFGTNDKLILKGEAGSSKNDSIVNLLDSYDAEVDTTPLELRGSAGCIKDLLGGYRAEFKKVAANSDGDILTAELKKLLPE